MTQLPRQRSARTRAVLAGIALLIAAGFIALGIWQIERRTWKHALIEAVETRIHAAPVAALGPAQWAGITAERDAYRRVRATGHFLRDRETLVQAVTDRGSGFWVVTPLQTRDFIVLVNRGFVPSRAARPIVAGDLTIIGLLRVTEPSGGFLRSNDPAGNRWYSRDVVAIAAAKGLHNVAPYFIDADAASNAADQPIGGLTVVRFNDHHLIYAITWFGLSGMSLWGAWQVLRTRKTS